MDIHLLCDRNLHLKVSKIEFILYTTRKYCSVLDVHFDVNEYLIHCDIVTMSSIIFLSQALSACKTEWRLNTIIVSRLSHIMQIVFIYTLC